jgi:tetratricopeptide (TPR) repeat protein
MKVIDAWGFAYKASMVWAKDRFGLGYYVRNQHELLLICTRGNLPVPPESSRRRSLVEAPRLEHSVKPPIFYEIIEAMYPGLSKIELFARTARPGWKAWGNQAESAARLLVEQARGHTDSKGQFVLPVEKTNYLDADETFVQAQTAEEAGDLQSAESFYRRGINLDLLDPAPGLNLGNLLRVQHRTVEAEAAYRWAVKADPNFPPAWHNLADLLDESGRLTEAVDCERRALTADPQYADAMFNLALFLQRLGNHAEAATWWTRYLECDRTSQWAERAKRALKYCEMEMASAASTAAEPAEATGRS